MLKLTDILMDGLYTNPLFFLGYYLLTLLTKSRVRAFAIEAPTLAQVQQRVKVAQRWHRVKADLA